MPGPRQEDEHSLPGGRATTRPGGRTAVHTKRIVDATIELLVEGGVSSLTFQAVAERAGVSRATMYRRWPSPSHLAVDAIRATAADRIEIADTGSLRGDLTTLMGRIGDFIASPVGRAVLVASLQIGIDEPGPGAPSWVQRWSQVAPIFDRAVARGELSDNVDAEALFAAVAGALYFRLQVMGQRVDEGWVARVLSGVLGDR